MSKSSERRRAIRIEVCIPAAVEVLSDVPADNALDPGYERVSTPGELAGQRFEAIISDLSVNGARLSANITPLLLSRLAMTFTLPGYGMALAVCIVMWRRTLPAIGPVSADQGGPQPGFGVLFEAVRLGARKAIDEMIEQSGS